MFASDRGYLVKFEQVRQVPKMSTLGVPKFFKIGDPKGVFIQFFFSFQDSKINSQDCFVSFQQCPKNIGVGVCKGEPLPNFFLNEGQKGGSNGRVCLVDFCNSILLQLSLVIIKSPKRSLWRLIVLPPFLIIIILIIKSPKRSLWRLIVFLPFLIIKSPKRSLETYCFSPVSYY